MPPCSPHAVPPVRNPPLLGGALIFPSVPRPRGGQQTLSLASAKYNGEGREGGPESGQGPMA